VIELTCSRPPPGQHTRPASIGASCRGDVPPPTRVRGPGPSSPTWRVRVKPHRPPHTCPPPQLLQRVPVESKRDLAGAEDNSTPEVSAGTITSWSPDEALAPVSPRASQHLSRWLPKQAGRAVTQLEFPATPDPDKDCARMPGPASRDSRFNVPTAADSKRVGLQSVTVPRGPLGSAKPCTGCLLSR